MYILYLRPTLQTLIQMRTIMQASPLEFPFDEFRVIVAASRDEIVIPDGIDETYPAVPQSLRLIYNESLGGSQLIMPLTSPEIVALSHQIEGAEHSAPYMIMLDRVPPMRRNYRAFINSISDTFATSGMTLEFGRPFAMLK